MSADWPRVPLGEVLTLQRRWVKVEPTESYSEIGVRCFGNGIFHKDPISGQSLGDKRVLEIHPGDLVLNNVFAWEGAVALAGPPESGKIGSHRFVTCTPDAERCLAGFFRWFFASEPGLDILRKVSPGSAGRNRTLNLAQFLAAPVPLPSLPEQRRIVERVEAVASRIAEAKRLRDEASEEIAAVKGAWLNSEFVTKRDSDWAVKPLGEVTEIQSGVTLGRVLTGVTVELPYLRVANVQDGRFDLTTIKHVAVYPDEADKWLLNPGDLLVTEGGDWDKLGRGSVWRAEIPHCIHQNHIFRIRSSPDQFVPEFLSALFASPYGKSYFQSAAKKTTNLASINQRQLKAFPVLAPSLPEQQRIVAHLDALQAKADSLRALQSETATELDALMPSVLNRAFAGEL